MTWYSGYEKKWSISGMVRGKAAIIFLVLSIILFPNYIASAKEDTPAVPIGLARQSLVVMKMYGTQSGESAYDRAKEAAMFSIKIGDTTLSLIEKEEATINKTRGRELALVGVIGSIKRSLIQFGKASWYGRFFHGRRTSSGERYNMYDYTAAHRKLPFGTEVLVTRLDNYKSVVVRVTDRGPYVAGRIIDLSKSAAEALGLVKSGVAKVRLDVIEKPQTID